ncbi:hypothetical protein Cgig2_015616 [Carnegiea gigantea]|uniref:Uncharacterized protein n=1 Tax=Carnegiea gigantea TaxID=171969 RepID=A0A9Q1H004_9CARY|nr:hypothetical protein Cgig2_015616 [Carnegiea gigantea]
MVINEVAELGLSSRDAMRRMMRDLQEQRWDIVEMGLQDIDERLRHAQVPRLVEMVYNPQPRPEVTSRLRGATLVSSDEEDILKGLAGLQVEGRHPQFPSLLAFINGRVVAGVLPKNQCRELRRISYAVPLFEPGTPSWSSCEYSSIPSILSPEVEVS